MKKLPILADFYYDRIGSWRTGNPFCIAFCYTSQRFKKLNEFIIKGGAKNVSQEIAKLKVPMIVFRTYWWHGSSRKQVTFENFKPNSVSGKKPYICGIQPWRINHGRSFWKCYEIRMCSKVWLTLRRVPRKWLPEYEDMLNSHRDEGVLNTIGESKWR
jgi:hypothetical protein